MSLTRRVIFFGIILLGLTVLNACGNNASSPQTLPPDSQTGISDAPLPFTPTLKPQATRTVSKSQAKPSPTILKNAKRIPETHTGRTQCLTCHEFGNVGPPMPAFHKEDKYDNTMCKRCHQGP